MKKNTTRGFIAGLALLASSAAWAGAQVHFNKPEQFTDVSFDQMEREKVLKDLAAHFEKLGESLKPGQTLKIDVTDLDMAGRENPSMRTTQDFRVMTGQADWPRMRLHYVLEQDGKVIGSADAALSDMSYMTRINRYSSGDKLRYEKQMIDDWFSATFGTPVKRPARK
ncbi:DUF3016 domain-containing protein [Janthinobacterium sp. BJB1]|uniref:DUF3016 domain-containing protein n=1 Tax=Janthinobacterium sp. GW458P TaxID=1981504 RepID=UPI000A3246DE|nr:DUF3016 domain-containing protein [Janthinobacterium sp. GW458P]MBE3027510.1 DUF3016 domain-containing protein [Janthinobacterium sp. GW458P]PHV15628.1 DUF3016 domain-containing protein [Janthinobacterium sp. BJB303]PJC96561.1 DUF3016 domain-containing protein [Janthinobacterium sp. BJB1]